MLVSGSDGDSRLHDLPALTSASGAAESESVSTSMGIRLTEDQNVMEPSHGGVLQLRHQRGQQILECPFVWLPCVLGFSDVREWIQHSLTHFQHVDPSTSNECCFCDAVFKADTGIASWCKRMMHVLDHHLEGRRLACGRPDFALFEYLWQKRVISEIDYRDLMTNNRDGLRAMAPYPSPPVSPDEPPVVYTETYRNTQRYRHRQRGR